MIAFVLSELQAIRAPQLRKLLETNQSTYALYYYEDDCRTCEDALDELTDALPYFEEVVPVFSVNCSADSLKKYCQKVESIPALMVHSTNLETPMPQQFFQDFDADAIVQFVQQLTRPNFLVANDTIALLEFLVTRAMTGRWLFVTYNGEPVWWFYEFAAQLQKRQMTMILQPHCDYEQYKEYEKASFFDRMDEDGMNMIIAVDGTMQFFPWEMVGSLDLDGNAQLAVQWVQEVLDAYDSGILHGASAEQDNDEL